MPFIFAALARLLNDSVLILTSRFNPESRQGIAIVSINPTQALSRIDYSRKRVLVVDDFAQHLEFMGKSLLAIGFREVELADTAEKALELCEKTKFDLVFCDYNMGEGKNGQQLLEEMRHLALVAHDCIFVMITAETSREVVLGAIEAEPEGYIAKPFNEAVLRRKIDRLLDKQACLQEVTEAVHKEQIDTAIKLCHEAAERHPRHQSWCLKTAAELHLQLGQFEEAKQLYLGFLDKRVLDWALLGLARAYMQLDEVEKAIAELQQVLVLNSNCVPAYDLLAECNSRLNDSHAVQNHLSQAVKLSPYSVERQTRLGDICVANADYEGAARAYRTALTTARHSIQESEDGYFKLAGAITDSMAGDMSRYDSSKAVEAHKVLRELDERFESKDITKTRKDLANVQILLKQQNPDKALALMNDLEQEELLDHERLGSSALFEYGKTLLNLGDEEKANEIFSELLKCDDVDESKKLLIRSLIEHVSEGNLGGRASELNEKGARLYEQDDVENSIKLFTEAARLSPKSIVVNLNLTQALLRRMEEGDVNKSYKQQSKSCLGNIGDLDENHKYFARYQNLSDRLKAIAPDQILEN